jgi:hypothetical protein
MKNIFIIFLFISSLHARESMQAVTSTSPQIVKNLANSVCSIGRNIEGGSCCTGFKISDNQIMTNFHCLACVSKVYAKMVDATPFMMEPSNLIYSIGNAPLEYRQEVIRKANFRSRICKF